MFGVQRNILQLTRKRDVFPPPSALIHSEPKQQTPTVGHTSSSLRPGVQRGHVMSPKQIILTKAIKYPHYCGA